MKTEIYVIQCGDKDLYKIGISGCAGSRAEDMQTGCPYELNVIHSVKVNIEESERVESNLHREYHSQCVRGEWFRLDSEKLFELKVRMYLAAGELNQLAAMEQVLRNNANFIMSLLKQEAISRLPSYDINK